MLDSGVESGFFRAPFIKTETGTASAEQGAVCNPSLAEVGVMAYSVDELEAMFPNSLPIPDHDHGLHHVILCVEECFEWKNVYKPTLAAMALFFNSKSQM